MNKKTVVMAVLAVATLSLLGALALWKGPAILGAAGKAPKAAASASYHCPMHPTIVSDRPGDCPVCKMSLVPIVDDLAPDSDDAAAIHGDHGEGVAGLAAVRLSPQKQQLIGVKTAAAATVPFVRTIRAVGRVAYDETSLRQIHTKISGYVERLYANETGVRVKQGQPLLEIYSPELLASQQEYLVALRARERTADSLIPAVAEAGRELVESARRRLELFDVSEAQILALEAAGRAQRTVTLHAPISGHVIQRHVVQGARVEPEMPLLEVADLSRVWVLASVYEYELPYVSQGQRATMTLSYLPGRQFEGRVSLIYPTLEAATRTAQVRLEFPNTELALKPDMYAEVRLTADLGSRLAVPDSAVMDTGTRSIVFVDEGEGFFQPREVKVGLRVPDLYEILSGLEPGERILTSGNFYVDSESKLRAALAAMAAPPAAGSKPEPPAHVH